MNTVVHVAGPYENGRQLCLWCGVILVSAVPDDIYGVANWPPPWPDGALVEIEIDEEEVLPWAWRVIEPSQIAPTDEFCWQMALGESGDDEI